MLVGLTKGIDVSAAQFAQVVKAPAAPGKCFSAHPPNQQVGHQASVTAITIREWMNKDQAMMQADRGFIGRVGVVVDPVPYVIKELCRFLADQVCGDTDVSIGTAESPRPGPDLIEHVLVKGRREFDAKHV